MSRCSSTGWLQAADGDQVWFSFLQSKNKLISQLAYRRLMVILRIADAAFLQRGTGLHSVLVNAGVALLLGGKLFNSTFLRWSYKIPRVPVPSSGTFPAMRLSTSSWERFSKRSVPSTVIWLLSAEVCKHWCLVKLITFAPKQCVELLWTDRLVSYQLPNTLIQGFDGNNMSAIFLWW